MSHPALAPFASGVWLVDFEFHQPHGERPQPICMVASEWRTGRTLRLWADELAGLTEAPFPSGPDALLVAYYASAELGCFLSLGWPLPARVLDLYAEFRRLTSGLPVPCGHGLLGALAYHGIDGLATMEKSAMRELAIRGGPYSTSERQALLGYCESDVLALAKLLPAMIDRIDMPRALLRGRYMAAAARMEAVGVPIDAAALTTLREQWPSIAGRLIQAIDKDYGVFIAAGQQWLDPESQRGGQIIAEAQAAGVEPYRVAQSVDEAWAEYREAHAERDAAIVGARKATGLTFKRINQWEDSGRDYSTWPGLDVAARELAGEYPILGLGPGYESHTRGDGTDYAGRLWQLLRNAPPPRRKSDPAIVGRAVAIAAQAGDDWAGERLTFSAKRFAEWLARAGIPWPRLPSGALALDDDTFRQQAKAHPAVAPLRELRHALSELRLESLAVGRDGRNRCLLSAFGSKTGRNQPSNARFIFGPSVWLRGLIRPADGWAVSYVDWEQQEFGIAAALSGDRAMMAAYMSGDPYLAFAKQAGAVPADATKATHQQQRDQFKVCALAVQYGMAEKSLAQSLGETEARARELLRLHHQTYPTFWRWSEAAVDHAMMHNYLYTVFGWRVRVGPDANPRSLANFPMQANGAEMLRLACCLATERGIRVCAPVHDALLIEAPEDCIEKAVADCQWAMAEASATVLGGFELRTDAKIIRHPDHYSDPRGDKMWQTVWAMLPDPWEQDGAPVYQQMVRPCTKDGAPALHPSNLISLSLQ